MKKAKLALNPETLSVKTFETENKAEELRGTVKGREAVPCRWSEPFSCPATVHTCATFDIGC